MPAANNRWLRILQAVFWASLLLAILGVVGRYLTEPYGDWDAWNTWNMRARFLFHAGAQWRQAFSPVFPHPDYPLLVPGSNARCWTYLGRDGLWVPQLLAGFFTFATVGMLTAGVCRLRGHGLGMLAGLVLLGTVAFLVQGAALYADVPLAFFFLGTVLLLAFHDAQQRPSSGLLILAGVTSSLAGWTKNEGLMFVPVVLAVRCAVAWPREGARSALKQAILYLAGAAPVLAVLILFKTTLAAEYDLGAGQSIGTVLARLADVSRHGFIAQSFVRFSGRVGRAYLVVLPLAMLLLGGHSGRRRGLLPGILGPVVLMLLGYWFVYAASANDLAWQVNYSMERLLIHLWPCGILAWSVYLADPVERLDCPQ